MRYKYGNFTEEQMKETKKYMRKQIYFLLLIVDPKTNQNYGNIDVDKAFDDVLRRIEGLSELLYSPPEIVGVVSLLQSALSEYHREPFNFSVYRKLVLDAGAEVLKIKEV